MSVSAERHAKACETRSMLHVRSVGWLSWHKREMQRVIGDPATSDVCRGAAGDELTYINYLLRSVGEA